MIKFVGDFEKLKDYGFEERPYAWVYGYDTDNALYNIQKHNGRIFRCLPHCGGDELETQPMIYLEDVIYNLIKDGYLVKEVLVK